jgi:hypothetical protein
MLKKLSFIFIQILFILLFTKVANAYVVPIFPSCSNPQGTLKVSYKSGTHYIVGGSGLNGSDAVFFTSDITLIQCFCAESTGGIQTDWWKVTNLSQSEIDQLVKLGWYFISSGADWGLENAPYLARNENYSCKSSGVASVDHSGPVGAPVCNSKQPDIPQLVSVIRRGTEAVVTWTRVDLADHYTLAYGTEIGNYPYGVPNTGNVTTFTVGALDPSRVYYFRVYAVNGCMPSEPSGTAPKGSAILGFATTGDTVLLYSVFITSILLIGIGILLKRQD